MPRPFKLVGMKREDDTPQHKAVREALTNSIIHSDVFLSGGILRIEKYDDRLCFRNPGTLKLPLEDIFEGGNSKASNPKIQDMLRMIGLGENLGSGFPKILDAWKEAKWNAPILEDRLTTEEVRLTLPIPFFIGVEGDNNVALNVALNTKYLSYKIGVSRKTIERELSILQKIKLIVWVGSKKYGHWEIMPAIMPLRKKRNVVVISVQRRLLQSCFRFKCTSWV